MTVAKARSLDLPHATDFLFGTLFELQPLFTSLKLAQAGSHLPAFLPSSLLPHACLFGAPPLYSEAIAV